MTVGSISHKMKNKTWYLNIRLAYRFCRFLLLLLPQYYTLSLLACLVCRFNFIAMAMHRLFRFRCINNHRSDVDERTRRNKKIKRIFIRPTRNSAFFPMSEKKLTCFTLASIRFHARQKRWLFPQPPFVSLFSIILQMSAPLIWPWAMTSYEENPKLIDRSVFDSKKFIPS